MDFHTPSTLSVSVTPSTNIPKEDFSTTSTSTAVMKTTTQTPPKSICPFSGAFSSPSSSSSSSCPFASSSSSSSSSSSTSTSTNTNTNTNTNTANLSTSVTTTPSSQHTCPFATAIPSSRRPALQTLPDGTVIQVARRCPKWVRVLRFSAKFIAKQVVMRTAKKALVVLFNNIRQKQNDNEQITQSFNEKTE